MSVIGYTVAGMFLGGFMYPHLYFLTGLTLGSRALANEGLARVPEPVPRVRPARPVRLAARGVGRTSAVTSRALTANEAGGGSSVRQRTWSSHGLAPQPDLVPES